MWVHMALDESFAAGSRVKSRSTNFSVPGWCSERKAVVSLSPGGCTWPSTRASRPRAPCGSSRSASRRRSRPPKCRSRCSQRTCSASSSCRKEESAPRQRKARRVARRPVKQDARRALCCTPTESARRAHGAQKRTRARFGASGALAAAFARLPPQTWRLPAPSAIISILGPWNTMPSGCAAGLPFPPPFEGCQRGSLASGAYSDSPLPALGRRMKGREDMISSRVLCRQYRCRGPFGAAAGLRARPCKRGRCARVGHVSAVE